MLAPARARPALHSFPTRRSSDLLLACACSRAADTGLEDPFALVRCDTGAVVFDGVDDVRVLVSDVDPDLGGAVAAGVFEHIVYAVRSEDHTSELQSRQYLVCSRLRVLAQLYTLSLHDALPISCSPALAAVPRIPGSKIRSRSSAATPGPSSSTA